MADADNCSSGGANDWELVSLTASTYAAAPGPILPPLLLHPHEAQPLAAILVSGHFNFPTDKHVDLLKQPHCQGGTDPVCHQEFSPAPMVGNDDDTDLNRSYAIISQSKLDGDGLPSLDFLDKHKCMSLDDVVFSDGNGVGGPSLPVEEQSMLCSPVFHTPDAGSDICRSAHCSSDSTRDVTADPVDLACLTADVPVGSVAVSGIAYIAKDQPKIPCQAWWKQTFSFLCNNAKESVTFRFIFVAATIVGLAILGQHLQHDKLQRQHFRLQFNVDSEKIVRSSVGEQGKGSSMNMIGGSRQSPVAQR